MDSIAVNGNVTTTTINDAYLAFTNLTHSNFTAQSTAEATVSSSSGNLGSNFSFPTNTINSTHSNATQQQPVRSNAFEVPVWLILCYGVILLCAIVGNLLVISTLLRNRRLRTITNVFLVNLAISDILLGVLCMPVTLVGTLLRHFIFGEFFCKLLQFSQAASVAVSSWTLVAISCERYYAICHPLSSRRWQTRSHAYKIIACIWCGSMLCMLPIAMYSQLIPTSRQGLRKCREHWPSYALPYERSYNLFLDLVLLVLPLMILSVAYILITRTLCVGMRIEKAMIFNGHQDHLTSALQAKTNTGNLLEKSLYLSTSSMSTSTSSRLRHSFALRCNDAATKYNASFSDISSVALPNQQGKLEISTNDTYTLYEQQHQRSFQPLQRCSQAHNFQNCHQQPKVMSREGCQQPHHQLQQQKSQKQHCCEPLSRLCCKRSNTSSSSTNSGRPHLYCMRFATLKTTTLPHNDENPTTNFCSANCCSGPGSTATLNDKPNTTPAIMALSSSSTAATSPSTSTMYRYHMQQQQQYSHSLQHNHARCYCVVQQVLPQSNNKADAKKSFNNKRSLKVRASVLRRNNIAKTIESKKRVIKMLAVLVLEFFICWTPLYVINTVAMYIGSAIYEYIDYKTISVLQLLAYSSSCCNPITYCFMNANFRHAFWDTFKGMQWCGNKFKRKRSAYPNGGNLCMAGSIRVNSCTVQTVIDSPRL